MSTLKSIPQYPGVPHTVFMSTWCSTILESPKSARNRREEFSMPRLFSAFISTSAFQKTKLMYLFTSDQMVGGCGWEQGNFLKLKKIVTQSFL